MLTLLTELMKTLSHNIHCSGKLVSFIKCHMTQCQVIVIVHKCSHFYWDIRVWKLPDRVTFSIAIYLRLPISTNFVHPSKCYYRPGDSFDSSPPRIHTATLIVIQVVCSRFIPFISHQTSLASSLSSMLCCYKSKRDAGKDFLDM